ncbi:MAG: HTH domain-containing protein [Thermovirgaceae bacterium]|nr:HTH domain-containing protein [Thermovirgaceae bacterium]
MNIPKNCEKNASRLFELVSEMEDILKKTGRAKDHSGKRISDPGVALLPAVANVLSLPLSQAARIILISSLLRSTGGDLHCRFNELAALSGLSERTAYRALKEIKQSGLFEILATPGVGVQISADWLWKSMRDGARKILEKGKTSTKVDHKISIASPKE